MTISKCSPTTLQEHAPEVWAIPFSLATTGGITIVFFSSPYLDVSVQEVGFRLRGWYIFNVPGCPIRKSSDITLVCSSPKLIAAYHVLHRLSKPRHPPYALICFKKIKSRNFRSMNLLTITTFFSQYVKELLNTLRSWSEDVQIANLQT